MEKKYITLVITILITIFIFSMSLSSGTQSGEMSSGFTVFIKNILDAVFVNNNISLDTLHVFVRKGAHVFEYFILGIAYYFTARAFNLSILKVTFIVLLTAGIDEWIQHFVPGRAGRLLDVFVYDFGGFILGFGLMLLILNRKTHLSEDQILYKIANNEISAKKGYKYLYHNENRIQLTNKAHFVKLSIQVPNEEGTNKFLKILFALPIPLGIVRFGLKFINTNISEDISLDEIKELINSKGIQITVDAASGEHVVIKTF